jgi:hypothetical protein
MVRGMLFIQIFQNEGVAGLISIQIIRNVGRVVIFNLISEDREGMMRDTYFQLA